MQITIKNLFHNTSVNTEVQNNSFTVSKYAWNKLCGISDCCCDHTQFFIADRRVYVEPIRENTYSIIESSELASFLASQTSAKKKLSSAENGKLGGRPRKNK